MKLQAKYTRITIILTICVLMLSSIAYYFLIRHVLINQLDDSLKVEEQEIIDYTHLHQSLPAATSYKDQRIEFVPATKPVKRTIQTKEILIPENHETDISRQLLFPVTIKGETYTAIVTKSQTEAEDLLFLILSITIGVIFLLLAFLFISNRFFIKKLWKPFYDALSAINKFNLSNPVKVDLPPTAIDEFNALNREVNEMTQKVTQDYESLRTFADHASHEMQTPLAVMNSKLDLLIQDHHLGEKNMHHLQSIYDAINKLTKLNHSLLLLSKIENNQFKECRLVRIDDLIKEKLIQLDEIIQSKQLSLSSVFSPVDVSMNPELADILVNNLLANAIRHNFMGGSIKAEASGNSMRIRNTAEIKPLDKNSVFNRFEKGPSSDGIGLGLAIVKQICAIYNFSIDYLYHDQMHGFQIRFG